MLKSVLQILTISIILLFSCQSKREADQPIRIFGSWRWLKSESIGGNGLITPEITNQDIVIVFKPDYTYAIYCNDTLTAENRKFYLSIKKGDSSMDNINFIKYGGLEGHQVYRFAANDSLSLVGFNHVTGKESMISMYVRVKND